MRMKRTLLTIVAAMALTMAGAAETAASLMRGLSERLSAPSVQAQFTIAPGAQNVQGHITVAGARFAMQSPEVSVWYDGVNQWTRMPSNAAEVSVTVPDADELLVINPFAVVNSYATKYDATLLAPASGLKRVKLTPRGQSPIKHAILKIAADGWPAGIEIEDPQGNTLEVKIDHIAPGNRVDDRVFRFDASRNPGVEIIDLR